MPDIVLTTANARFRHSSLALRYLKANLTELEPSSEILEFTIDERPGDLAEKILTRRPRIVGLSLYLWNTELLGATAALLKRIRPELVLVLGGPEISYETKQQPIYDDCDYVISGPGERPFYALCRAIIDNRPPREKIICNGRDDLKDIALPYHLYTDEDIARRVIYLEASRGCPFRCHFCLSSLDRRVNRFDEDSLLAALEHLWQRGARQFKFIDRALHLGISPRLLTFFLEKQDPALFCHFELVPDRLSEELTALLARFPAGAIQLEVGVQSFDDEVTARIGRRQDGAKTEQVLRTLLADTRIHLHTDLVVGLPGQSIDSIAGSFDRLIRIKPQEIQVGILKRLRGAPIADHDEQWAMVYNPRPPYDILHNRLIDFATMQRLKRFSRFFDLVYNSGNFVTYTELLWQDGSPFVRFLALSDWLYDRLGRTGSIALHRLTEALFAFACQELNTTPTEAANRLAADFSRLGRTGLPHPVQRHVTERPPRPSDGARDLANRQQRHLA